MKGKRVMKTNRKAPVALVAMLVLLGCVVTGTVAYLFTNTNAVTNTFTPAKVTTYVQEDFDGTTKKDVKIQNTGNIPAYIRATVIVNWADAEGNVYGGAVPAEGTDYTISYNTVTDANGGKWIKDTNGYWYYTKAVDPNEYTGILISECKLKDGVTPPSGYNLQVTILADGIQSQPDSVVHEVWPAVQVSNSQLVPASTGN